MVSWSLATTPQWFLKLFVPGFYLNYWWWIHPSEIFLFRDLVFDLKVGTFLSFCLYFAKLDVGISLGLDL